LKTILIALPFGQTVRDVLRGDTYRELLESGDRIVIITGASSDVEFINEFKHENVYFEHLGNYKPNKMELLFQSFYLSTLASKSNTIRLYAKSNKQSALRLFIPLSNFISKLIGRFNLQKLLGYFMKISNPKKMYTDVFEKYKPDLVVVTRVLRASPDYPILKEATDNKIPVIALVSSWDNFTTKGFFPFGIKKIVVWNEIMKKEATELFGFPEKDIYMSGIPRFDNYFNLNTCSKEEFYERYNIPKDNKLLTYTTGNKTLVLPPNSKISAEADITFKLAEIINNGDLGDVTLLVRLHPLADINDFKELDNYENVILQIPGKQKDFKDRVFSKNDDLELAETLKHSDLILNVASTISVDAAIFDTPTLSVCFDIRGELPFHHSVSRIYEYEHYRTLRKTGGITLIKSIDEMIYNCKKYLDNPNINKTGIENIVKQQCLYTDGKSSQRVGKFIINYLKEEVK